MSMPPSFPCLFLGRRRRRTMMYQFLIALVFYLSFARAQLFFDTTAIHCKKGVNAENLCYTDTTSSSSSQGLDVLTASFINTSVAPWDVLAFMKDSDEDQTCTNRVCELLVKYHTNFTKGDGEKFNTCFSPSVAGATDQQGVAGYLAPTPGYCGAQGKALMELYSESLDSYMYMLPDELDDASKDTTVTRAGRYIIKQSLGYLFEIGTKLPAHGSNPDYIDPSVTQVAQTFHPLQDIYRFKSKTSTKTTFAAISKSINAILGNASAPYDLDNISSVRVFVYNNLVSTARVKCGATNYLYEVYDSVTDTTRLSSKTKFKSTDKTVGVAGFTLKAASPLCGFTYEAVEYQNKADPTHYVISTSVDTQYSTSADWIVTQSLGFVRSGTYLLRLTK